MRTSWSQLDLTVVAPVGQLKAFTLSYLHSSSCNTRPERVHMMCYRSIDSIEEVEDCRKLKMGWQLLELPCDSLRDRHPSSPAPRLPGSPVRAIKLFPFRKLLINSATKQRLISITHSQIQPHYQDSAYHETINSMLEGTYDP